MLAHVSDATIRLAGIWFAAGGLFFVGLFAAMFWRRLTRAPDGTLRLLRLALDDAQATIVVQRARLATCQQEARTQQRVIDEQTEQIGQLYRDCDRLARRYVEQADAKGAGRPGQAA